MKKTRDESELREVLQHTSIYLKTVKVMKNKEKTGKPSWTTRNQGEITNTMRHSGLDLGTEKGC